MLLITFYYIKLFILFFLATFLLFVKLFILISSIATIVSYKSLPTKIIFTPLVALTLLTFIYSNLYYLALSIFTLSCTIIFKDQAYSVKRAHISFINLSMLNIQFIADMYSTLYITANTRVRILHIFKTLLVFAGTILTLIFATVQQLTYAGLLLLTTILTVSSVLVILTYLTISSHAPSISTTWPRFPSSLLVRQDIRTLQALVEEDFFDDILDLEEPYSTYPIFFKSCLPAHVPKGQELYILWYIIRWESALSKHSGLTTSLWAIKSTSSFPNAPSYTFSTHTPIIPVFSDRLFNKLQQIGFPVINPANIPDNWSPYTYIASHYKWPKPAIKPERTNEIEEEDWQCSLTRTFSLHLKRRNFPHCLLRIWW